MIGARKNWIFAATLALALAGFFVTPGKAEAASGGCFFGANSGTCSVSGDGAYRTNDIFTNGSYRTTSGAGAAMAGVNTKGEFINYVVSRFNSGNAQNKTGAEFVIRTMLDGHGAHQSRPGTTARDKWVDLIQSPSVTVDVVNGVNVCVTSWYVPSANNTFFDNYTSGCKSRDVIRIKQNGYVIADIEILCGNMTGRQDRTLHTWAMNANSVATNAGGANITGGHIIATETIYWTHSVYWAGGDGPTSANIAGKVQWGGNGPTGTYGPDPTYNQEFWPGWSITRSGSYATSFADIGRTICQRITANNRAYNDLSSFASGWACVIVDPPPIINCQLSASPNNPDPYTTLTFNLTFSPASAGNTSYTFQFHDKNSTNTKSIGPTLVAAGVGSVQITVTPSAAGFDQGDTSALATVSAYGLTAYCNGTARASTLPPCDINTCPLVTPVTDQPYLAVYGADTVAGTYPQTGGVCGTNNAAGVISWNHDAVNVYGDSSPATDYAGGGGRGGVFAKGNISHFSSGLNITNLKPTGLSFANTTGEGRVNLSTKVYGGHTATTAPVGCGFTSGTVTDTAIANGYSNTSFSGNKYFAVTGDVYIGSGGIKYANSGGGWTQLSDIPSFKLVVTGGNIYIDNDVTELDGLYVAIPSSGGAGGEIYTCATSLGAPVSKGSGGFAATCNKQLKIYGAFAAKTVHFDRAYGTIGQARSSDNFTNDHSAEQFIYSPEMWLPNGSNDGQPTIINYQGLAPIL